MDWSARRKAQQRVDRIKAFSEELAELEREQALTLTPEQEKRLGEHLEHVLAGLNAEFGVDVTESSRRISWGMRLASLLGAAALYAALVLFLHRIWGALPTAAQVAIVMTLPLLALAAAELTFRRDAFLFYSGLLAWIAGVGFAMQLSALGSVFNVVPVGKALLAWGLFAILLAHAYGLRLLLAAGLVVLAAYGAGLSVSLQGAYWEDYLERPEAFVALGLVFYGLGLVYRQDRNDFGFVCRVCGALLTCIAVLFLAFEGQLSYLRFPHRTVETLYQFAGLVLSGGLVFHGVRLGRSGLVNVGALAFVVFLYVKLHAWWWAWMPKSLFFLLIGLTAVLLLYVFRQLRGRLAGRATP